MLEQGRRWHDRMLPWCLLAALIVVFPLVRLFPLTGTFTNDWDNNAWFAGYEGEYLRQHGAVPVVVNTTEQVGMPYPIFYGTLFYPLISTLTVWFNPGLVLRAVAVVLTALQLRLIPRALVRVGLPLWVSRGVACLVIWTIYPLTNLYNRSAIAEYVATGLQTCMVATWFLIVHAERASDRTRYSLGLGLLFTLAAGTHPITGLYSLPVLALLLLAGWVEHGRRSAFWLRLVKALVVPVGLAAVVLAPWLYALSKFNMYLHISSTGLPWVVDDSIDRWLVRFFPIPFDIRTLHTPLSEISSPYLDAQLNLPMLVLLIGWLAIFALRNRGSALMCVRSVLVALLAFAYFTWLSLSSTGFYLLPLAARMVQMVYRMITYENLALLLGMFLLAGFLRRRRDASLFAGRPLATGLLVGCMAVSGVGVVIKWWHASAIMHLDASGALRIKASERRRWVALPETFYGADAYITPGLYAAPTEAEKAAVREVRFPIGIRDHFGLAGPVRLQLPEDTWIATNVQAFPWNKLEIDGTTVKSDHLRADPPRLLVRVPAGDHVLTFREAPAAIWSILRSISFAVLVAWLGYVLYLNYRRQAPSVQFPADEP